MAVWVHSILLRIVCRLPCSSQNIAIQLVNMSSKTFHLQSTSTRADWSVQSVAFQNKHIASCTLKGPLKLISKGLPVHMNLKVYEHSSLESVAKLLRMGEYAMHLSSQK